MRPSFHRSSPSAVPIHILPSRAASMDVVGRAGQPGAFGEGANRRLTKLIKTIGGSDPDCPFTVFEKGDDQIGCQAIGLGK